MRFLFLFLALTSPVAAASIQPAWIEAVYVTTYDEVTTVSQYHVTNGLFGVANLIDPRSGQGTNYMALVCFLGATETPALAVLNAAWMGGNPDDVPLYLSPFTPSLTPPVLTEPIGPGGPSFYLHPGDYSSAPILVSLEGIGDVCYLIGTESNIYFGPAVIALSVVPEPSSLVMLAIGCGVLAMVVMGRERHKAK
jgi:hypothetical protein